jgi:small-conductance mechanosensitive channel/CRP-like cAMP-binding protein
MTDPLLLLFPATVFVFAIFLVPQPRMKWPIWLRATWSIANFIILTLMLRALIGSPLHPHFDDSPGIIFWEKLLDCAWWLLGARGVIGLIRFIMVLEQRSRETQIISDLAAGAVYIATALAIVDFVFSISVGGLLATSGIIAIVIGLALQSTLADVFSGIAVGVERPYRAGDLIWVDGGIEGEVIQVTWRSTQIATFQNNIAIVPNSVMAKARLINRSRPTMMTGETLAVRLAPSHPPERCVEVLTAAVRSCRTLLSAPAPEITCTSLNGDGYTYQLSFSVASSGELAAAKHELLSEIHRQLHFAGIALAVAGTTLIHEKSIPSPAEILQQSELFGVIEQPQRDLLASHFKMISLQAGETLIQQGDEPDALYVMASGAVEISINKPSGRHVAHILRPGESLGAIGLITGSNYAATGIALTPVKAYRLDKDAIAAAIRVLPELAEGLEALAHRGKSALHKDSAAHEEDRQDQPEMFLSRLRGFIQLMQSRA